MSSLTARRRGIARGARVFVTVAFAAVLAALGSGPASALDLGAPGRAVNKLLGREPAPVPARPGPATPRQGPAAPPAEEVLSAADSVMVDEIVLSPEPYVYRSYGMRDPFVSLLSDSGDEDGVGTEEIQVRGILWGEHDRFALVETSRGTSKILRAGDRFGNFTVTRIDPDAVVIFSSVFGTGRTQRLPLVEWKGSQNARGER